MMSWRRMQSQRKLLQFNQNGRLMSVLNPSCKLNLWLFSLHVIPFSLSLSPDFPVKLWAFLFKYRLKAKKKKKSIKEIPSLQGETFQTQTHRRESHSGR